MSKPRFYSIMFTSPVLNEVVLAVDEELKILQDDGNAIVDVVYGSHNRMAYGQIKYLYDGK